jgi:hypothetical protein
VRQITLHKPELAEGLKLAAAGEKSQRLSGFRQASERPRQAEKASASDRNRRSALPSGSIRRATSPSPLDQNPPQAPPRKIRARVGLAPGAMSECPVTPATGKRPHSSQAARPASRTGPARRAGCRSPPARPRRRNRCSAPAPATTTHRRARRASRAGQNRPARRRAG